MRPSSFARLVTLVGFGLSVAIVQAASLPSLNINSSSTSVSGLSSGGYMAVQFHIANSSFVKGAGVIAGGPYFCAKDSQDTATQVCSCTGLTTCQPSQAAQMVANLIQTTNQNESLGRIDATSNLAGSKVWLFSGSADDVVPTSVMTALETYYKNYVSPSNITFEKSIPAQHAMPTDSFGNACSFRGDPFINNCPYDAAGNLLQWIYGPLNPKNTGTLTGQLIEFDQSEFIANPASHGMSPTGWAYVPDSCRQNAGCRVHVAFHGCKQYPDWNYSAGPNGKFGDTFARHSGYNEWADTNNIVVLYPQANAMTIGTRLPRSNPAGCWDWWGYDDTNYAVKSGRQMTAVKLMIDRLAGVTSPGPGPSPSPGFCGKASNDDHVAAGRAYVFFFWWYFANGSNDYLGLSGTTQTTLKEAPTGVYHQVNACS